MTFRVTDPPLNPGTTIYCDSGSHCLALLWISASWLVKLRNNLFPREFSSINYRTSCSVHLEHSRYSVHVSSLLFSLAMWVVCLWRRFERDVQGKAACLVWKTLVMIWESSYYYHEIIFLPLPPFYIACI